MKTDGSNTSKHEPKDQSKYQSNLDTQQATWFDVIEMQTCFALWQSMKRSKILTVMVIVGSAAIVGFLFFVKHLAIY